MPHRYKHHLFCLNHEKSYLSQDLAGMFLDFDFLRTDDASTMTAYSVLLP